MYIIGHYVTSSLSRRYSSSALLGSDGPALYLPDFVRCHEWGYSNCFSMPDSDLVQAFIKAHMLGDWWVHYGSGNLAKRKGWAYKRMSIFSSSYQAFFDEAERLGLADPDRGRDSVRGFSHTMMEYCIDSHLARTMPHEQFDALRDSLCRLGLEGERWSIPHLKSVLQKLGVQGDFGHLDHDVESFRSRVAASQSAHEFAIRAGVKKFGLQSCDESLKLVDRTIQLGLMKIPSQELDTVVSMMAEFISLHTSTAH